MSRALVAGILGAAAAVAWWGWGTRDPVEVAVTTLRRGDLAESVEEEARARYRVVRWVSMPTSGRLEVPLVEEGDPVRAGQVLARVDRTLPAAAAEGAAATVRQLRAERRLLEDRASLEAARDAARARRDKASAQVVARDRELDGLRAAAGLARRDAARLENLARGGAADAAALDRAQATRDQAEARLAAAEAGRRSDLAEQRAAAAALAEAEAELARLPARLAALDARTQAAEAAAVAPTDDLGRVELTSPLDGVVLRVLHRSEGFLSRGEPLFEVGDPSTLEVEVDLLSADAARCTEGGLYAAYGGALGDEEVRLRLRRISSRAFPKRSSLGVEEQRVHGWFTFRRPPPGLGHGFRVRLRAAVAVARGAWLVPRRAVYRRGQDWFGFTVRDGQARRVPVTLGLGDVAWVELTSGGEAGVEWVLDAPEDLRDGDRVTPRPATDLHEPRPLPGASPTTAPR